MKVGTIKGRFPSDVARHWVKAGKPICRPNDLNTYTTDIDHRWQVSCKNCKRIATKTTKP